MRVAVVVQRYGTEVVGGSETLARQYAQILSEFCEVEVLTTCALNHQTWANHYQPGYSVLDGIPVRRFASDFQRGNYWQELYRLLLGPTDVTAFPGSSEVKQAHAKRLASWPRALQEETIRWQGPYSSALLDHLRRTGGLTAARRGSPAYDVFLFFAYLFPTAYFGMRRVARQRVVFCPTLHDEPIAYLPVFRRAFERPYTVFLTESERALARRLYGVGGPGEVVGMPVRIPSVVGRLPVGTPRRYVLYAGRLEGSKGTDTLVEHFTAYKRWHPSDLKLVLIGQIAGELLPHPDVIHLGYVPEAEKFALMRSAQLFIHPSPYESFAIVLLESFLMGTPALVNGDSVVLMEHCRRSGAAVGYRSREEFCRSLQDLLADELRRTEMGERGRRFVEEEFSAEPVSCRLRSAVKQVFAQTAPSRPDQGARHC
jgi:glycosyltransferase involved in cell wall biosynthesis